MSVAPIHHVSPSLRAYWYLALVPICSLLGWAVIIHIVKGNPSESSVYRALNLSQYSSAVGMVVLVAIPIRFRKAATWMRLVTVSLLCGLAFASITFVGYMTVGFG
jgi:hypothetical protein